VSILWALGSEQQRLAIRQAHREAVDEVVAYLEHHAVHARISRPGMGQGRSDTDGLVAAAFDHRTSRAGDPLLHSHVVTANLTRTPDGGWRALDARGLFEHAHAAGYLYQAHLRHLLSSQLGMHFEPVHHGIADVTGVPRPVIDAFSKRRDEIEEVVAESGQTSAQARQVATLSTRRAKEYGVDPATTEDRWREEAAELGFHSEEVAACFGVERSPSRVDVDSLFRFLAGSKGVTAQASTFQRHDVIEAIAERLGAVAAPDLERMVDAFLASSQVVPLAPDATNQRELVWRRDGSRTRSPDLARFTTPELLAKEADLLLWTSHGFGHDVQGVASDTVEDVLARWTTLSDEQRAAVRVLCAPDGLAIQPVAGRPGAGKTYAMAAAIEAMTAAGTPVVGCAIAATAASELEAATKLGAQTGRSATTMARLFIELERRPLPIGAVVLVDEASMVGTRDLHRLARHVGSVGGRLWLVGDPDQHGPVDAGGMFRRLIVDHTSRVPRLIDNRRQTSPKDRAAIDAYREEMVDSALSRYDAEGRVHRAPTAAASYRAMVERWYESASAGSRDPMIAGQHRVRRALNRGARSRLLDAGAISGTPLVSSSGRDFAVGDWVVAQRNAYRLRSEVGFVKNGSAGVVVGVDHEARSLQVAFDRDGIIDLPAAYVDAWLDHGYARTTYGVQGQTLERALYHAGDASSFEEGYVALTRGRSETHLYVVDGDAVIEDDERHDGHDVAATGLATVTEALERRRSRTLALDADPLGAEAAARFHATPLAELQQERRRLEAALAGSPQPVERERVAAEARRDDLVARRRVADLASLTDDRVENAIEVVDDELAALDLRAAERKAWERVHDEELASLRLVRRAESAAQLQDRLQVSVPRYTNIAVEQAWRVALEAVAVDGGRSRATHARAQIDAALHQLGGPRDDGAELELDLG
jgi:conjugative relaxase-like TrwC/TraI family protein